jgi:hypothetical protein
VRARAGGDPAELALTFGDRSDPQVRLAASAGTFTWLLQEGRMGRLAELHNPASPAQLMAFIRGEDPYWRRWFGRYGFTAADLEALAALAVEGRGVPRGTCSTARGAR